MSAVSPQGKPWAIEIDSTPFLPSIAISLSTKPRIGSRLVCMTEMSWQSNTPRVGRMRPSALATHRSTSS